ncbi:MAG TPA: hypothetical protein VFZ64_09040 [Nocardioidaceae bacterium]
MDGVTLGVGAALVLALLLGGTLITFGPLEIVLYQALIVVALVLFVVWARRRRV